ncbi:MAG: Na+/H+ antiporter subunit E [Candidatus Margulisbacteria bacterium]|nr:Na+/H+ antiporter subunit E [Candidatus Margulisiibacteriota bacterium]MBU1021855.1 Na+/H+ antiporter subunit E [Candidatus Margulisiibacteriota bacterium]MBU1729014.1 Na+/H+ antiporter subunit E [Candidatus Margulisiibacteriota bacterium]MBU1954433.1 Na+/H+ antiporter subunit E [Candidatus Margulisiibacteriota bacterium]
MSKFILTFVFLMIFWLLFTLSLDPFSILLGAVFSFIISTLTYDFFIEGKDKFHSKDIFTKVFSFIAYVLVLFREIYIGSINVVYSVITMNIKPGIIVIRTHLKSEFARVLLANSITLTPGTVTVDMEGDLLTVHWLHLKTKKPHHAAKMIKGSFEKELGGVFN